MKKYLIPVAFATLLGTLNVGSQKENISEPVNANGVKEESRGAYTLYH